LRERRAELIWLLREPPDVLIHRPADEQGDFELILDRLPPVARDPLGERQGIRGHAEGVAEAAPEDLHVAWLLRTPEGRLQRAVDLHRKDVARRRDRVELRKTAHDRASAAAAIQVCIPNRLHVVDDRQRERR
jgi:hypothetical protein